jgi:predicted transcriptional regulator of viral defense system
MDDIAAIAEENDGLVTSRQARRAGLQDSVLSRLTKRGRLERVARGVYRVAYSTPDRFSQYREAVLWAKAQRGPQEVAVSHFSALMLYGISDANPRSIEITVPKTARLRRRWPKGVVVHRAELAGSEVTVHEGIPVTTIVRTVADLISTRARVDLVRQAVGDARREGLIDAATSRRLRREVDARKRAEGSVNEPVQR